MRVALLELDTNALVSEEMDELCCSFTRIQFPTALLDALIVLTRNVWFSVVEAVRLWVFTL
jgi:hypothetical protein